MLKNQNTDAAVFHTEITGRLQNRSDFRIKSWCKQRFFWVSSVVSFPVPSRKEPEKWTNQGDVVWDSLHFITSKRGVVSMMLQGVIVHLVPVNIMQYNIHPQ